MSASTAAGNDTTVFVTGFGPFANIKVNPSTTVGKRVAQALEKRGDLTAVHFTELETSVVAASAYFDDLEKQLDAALEADAGKKFLLFHIGVHSGEKNGVMRIETMGFNELHAAVPDVRGVQFNHDPINSDDGDIEASIESFFAQDASVCGTDNVARLASIVDNLNAGIKSRAEPTSMLAATDSASPGVKGSEAMVMPKFQLPHWVVSTNAGRYLCNYCLYRGLRLQKKYTELAKQRLGDAAARSPPVVCVFIHVCDPAQGKIVSVPKGDDAKAHAEGPEVDTRGDNPTSTASQPEGPIEEYNPSLMEQAQQTALVAHELADWVRGL